MPRDPFATATYRLFAHRGQEAIFRGLPTQAILAHGVSLIGDAGQLAGLVTTATLPAELAPKVGELIGTPSDTRGAWWEIDSLQTDDSYKIVVILRPAAAP